MIEFGQMYKSSLVLYTKKPLLYCNREAAHIERMEIPSRKLYHMRKHQRRNTYDIERASAAAVRKAQATKQPRRTRNAKVEEHTKALLECSKRIITRRMKGEPPDPELQQRYTELLKQGRTLQR